jgi:hypothetical protein
MKRIFISLSNEQYIAILEDSDPAKTIRAYCCFSPIDVFDAEARYIGLNKNILVAEVKDISHTHYKQIFKEVSLVPEKWLKKLQEADVEI